MIAKAIISVRHVLTLALLVCAVGLAGFSHSAPVQEDRASAEFLAAGFLISDICGLGGSKDEASPIHCLACLPPAQALLPTPCAAPLRVTPARVVWLAPAGDGMPVRMAKLRANGPRAPPLI